MVVNYGSQAAYKSSDWYENQTAHGLLVVAYDQAKGLGLMDALDRYISLKMKTVIYTVTDKLMTLMASILVGCDHTVQINDKLGPQEQALAQVFGFERFPDQSTINRLLQACKPQTVEQLRQINQELLFANTRARRRQLRTKLKKGRVLFVDLDQRGIVVSGKEYELAEAGFFGSKRGHRGYQLSAAFIGGQIGELLDEYLDGGKMPACARIDELLASIKKLATACKIPLEKIVIRADSQYGTVAIINKIVSQGFSFLIKNISPERARAVALDVKVEDFRPLTTTSEGRKRFVADLGQRRYEGKPQNGVKLQIEARTIVVKWYEPAKEKGPRPGPKVRHKRAQEPKPEVEHRALIWTNLSAQQLPAAMAVDLYDDRATIERYFRDEQSALGARSIRTHHAAGAAVFQMMVAITNNLLKWIKATCFTQTPLQEFGVGRLIKQAFQLPALLIRSDSGLEVIFPKRHALTDAIVTALAPHQLLLPLDLAARQALAP